MLIQFLVCYSNLESDIFVPHAGCYVIYRKPHLKISLLYQKVYLSARKVSGTERSISFSTFFPSRRFGFFSAALCVDWQSYLGCWCFTAELSGILLFFLVLNMPLTTVFPLLQKPFWALQHASRSSMHNKQHASLTFLQYSLLYLLFDFIAAAWDERRGNKTVESWFLGKLMVRTNRITGIQSSNFQHFSTVPNFHV